MTDKELKELKKYEEQLKKVQLEITHYEAAEKRADEKMNEFLTALLAMQSFNYKCRPDDVRELFFLMENDFSFERNSEGTTLWLALALAIKELYGFSDKKFLAVMTQLLKS